MDKHTDVMEKLRKDFAPILDSSPDGVYLWLDEKHMIVNDKLARMFGFSAKEMENQPPFLEVFVAEKDQQMFSSQYHTHIANLSGPVRFNFHALRKDGKEFLAETDMIPITYAGHAIAYHFVRKV